MTTLTNYIVIPALYQQAGGLEAQVGDQVKLYLDTDAQPGFPEFILGVIQHPIVRVCDGTAYSIEYDESDLVVAEAIHPDDVVSAEVFQAWDQLAVVIDAEIARATAAEADLANTLGDPTPLATPDTIVKRDAFGNVIVGQITATMLRVESENGSTTSSAISLTDDRTVNLPDASGVYAVTQDPTGIPDKLVATEPVVFPNYTVAGLPPAANFPYGRAFVSDSADGFGPATVGMVGFSGGGSNKVPVYSDGSVWIIG